MAFMCVDLLCGWAETGATRSKESNTKLDKEHQIFPGVERNQTEILNWRPDRIETKCNDFYGLLLGELFFISKSRIN